MTESDLQNAQIESIRPLTQTVVVTFGDRQFVKRSTKSLRFASRNDETLQVSFHETEEGAREAAGRFGAIKSLKVK